MNEWTKGDGWKTEPGEPDIVDVRPADRKELWRARLTGFVWGWCAFALAEALTFWLLGGGQ